MLPAGIFSLALVAPAKWEKKVPIFYKHSSIIKIFNAETQKLSFITKYSILNWNNTHKQCIFAVLYIVVKKVQFSTTVVLCIATGFPD